MEPRKYLRQRLAQLDSRYYDRWPCWTNDDYVAVAVLLSASRLTRNEADSPECELWNWIGGPHDSGSQFINRKLCQSQGIVATRGLPLSQIRCRRLLRIKIASERR